MKKFKTIIMLLLVAIALYAQRTPRVTNDFKEGDLIFQVSQSRQSPFIQLATTPKPIKSYHIFGFGKLMKRRGMDPNQKVVAPCDLL